MPDEHSTRAWRTRQVLNDRRAGAALARGEGYARHRPVEVYLQTASGCNLDCYMCSEHLRPVRQRHGRGLVSMEPELYARIAEEIFPWSMRTTFGVGGEPMLSEHFLDFVRLAHERGQEVHLTTNGTRIHTDEAAEVLARCASAIDLSLDAAGEATYERIRLGSSWARMRSNLERLNRYRLARPKGQRCRLRLGFVLMRSNVHELPDFVRFAAGLEADAVHAQHVIPVTEEGRAESLFADKARSDHYLREAERVGAELGLSVELPRTWSPAPEAPYRPGPPPAPPPDSTPPEPGAGEADGHAANGHAANGHAANGHATDGSALADALESAELARASGAPVDRLPAAARNGCHLPTLAIYVFYDGRVFPCCHPYAHKQMLMGDLRTSSFEEIWNGRAWRNLRAGLASGRSSPICRACSIAHSPPPEAEDPARELAPEHSIGRLYGELDLAPPPPPAAGARALLAKALEHAPEAADRLWSDPAGRAVSARRIDKLGRTLGL